ncbi:hypothetical protein RJ641_035713 [Dillenia turbinata]|uniref:Uncharacterized protein n=1 Tax=Dillenia turbinata TaxID=194707 RepID=A0AAN8VI99_9MAGN
MESETPSFGECGPQESSNYDELFMHKTMIFSENLKVSSFTSLYPFFTLVILWDLRNLRKQLHSAAEYFEESYRKDEQKQLVMETLKDYVIKVLINTVDHLGSVAYKVNTVLDEKAGEISGAERQLSCIEQRLRSCQKLIDQQGLAEQLLVIDTPKHHKRYTLPFAGKCWSVSCVPHATALSACFPLRVKLRDGKSLHNIVCRQSNHQSYNDDNASQTKIEVNIVQTCHFVAVLLCSISANSRELKPFEPNLRYLPPYSEKRADSPLCYPFLRSGSLVTRPVTPNPANVKRYPSETRRSVSFSTAVQRDKAKDIETQPSKSKRIMKAFLSMRKSKKGDSFYRYLDEN